MQWYVCMYIYTHIHIYTYIQGEPPKVKFPNVFFNYEHLRKCPKRFEEFSEVKLT